MGVRGWSGLHGVSPIKGQKGLHLVFPYLLVNSFSLDADRIAIPPVCSRGPRANPERPELDPSRRSGRINHGHLLSYVFPTADTLRIDKTPIASTQVASGAIQVHPVATIGVESDEMRVDICDRDHADSSDDGSYPTPDNSASQTPDAPTEDAHVGPEDNTSSVAPSASPSPKTIPKGWIPHNSLITNCSWVC